MKIVTTTEMTAVAEQVMVATMAAVVAALALAATSVEATTVTITTTTKEVGMSGMQVAIATAQIPTKNLVALPTAAVTIMAT